jgi:hypothetical protein
MNQEGSGILARLFLFVAIALGALICVALVWVMVAGALNNLTVAGPIIAGIFALVIFAVGEWTTRKRIAQQYRWDKIADEYLGFVGLIRRGTDLQNASPKEKAAAEAEMEEFFGTFRDKLMLWGSPGVIRAWSGVRRTDWESVDSTEAMLIYARVLVAIREDLGHTRNLDVRDLLGVTISDIDEHLPPGRQL